ncbi:hypothetical protein PspLS_04046 [Pyricularia sp. CBS 133598]|nr:hypothetical protein PspLS_04046 [Pyricularia sp. CBS 133598]
MSSSETPNGALPLAGKTALVTGASRGIGAGIALDLARQGAAVILHYASPSSQSKVEAVCAEIASLPHKPSTSMFRADLSSADGASTLLADIKAQHGGDSFKLDILVNNAGMSKPIPLAQITVADYEATYGLNVRGPLLVTQAVLPHLNPRSRIVNVSSVGARAGYPSLSLYCSSKAALEGLTRVWAAELGGDGTTVNCVAPGPVESEMLDFIPQELVKSQRMRTPVEKRTGRVDEVARVVTWLCGEGSGWVSGQTISASGGYAMY